MTAFVLTTGAVLQCPHGGLLVTRPGQLLLSVDGQSVLTRSDLFAAAFVGCLTPRPCTKIQSVATGLATTLLVGADPVALASATGLTDVQAPWQVISAGQTKLEAV